MLLVPASTTSTLASVSAIALSEAGDILYFWGFDSAAGLAYGWSYSERLRQLEDSDDSFKGR